MTDETQGERIIRRLGGRQRAAEITGYPLTRIDSWRRTGKVAQDDWPHIMAVTADWDAPITPWDFIAHLVRIQASCAVTEHAA